ncbi:hypothetical protein K5M45_00425, partial [Serratia marcescens]|uniref:hypothetical protein n=8 Tax=Serratia TaxID=613 RepID=UPI001C8B90C3
NSSPKFTTDHNATHKISRNLFTVEFTSKKKEKIENKCNEQHSFPQDQLSQNKISKIIPNKMAKKNR